MGQDAPFHVKRHAAMRPYCSARLELYSGNLRCQVYCNLLAPIRKTVFYGGGVIKQR